MKIGDQRGMNAAPTSLDTSTTKSSLLSPSLSCRQDVTGLSLIVTTCQNNSHPFTITVTSSYTLCFSLAFVDLKHETNSRLFEICQHQRHLWNYIWLWQNREQNLYAYYDGNHNNNQCIVWRLRGNDSHLQCWFTESKI